MNNYIDERILPYKRPQVPANRYVRAEKGRPLARRARKDNIGVRCLKVLAEIFLLLVSTFSGEIEEKNGNSETIVEKAVKSCALYGGILLALWGVLVVLSNLVNAVTLLPTWSLIIMFAAIILIAAGALKR